MLQRLQAMLLAPLRELSTISQIDVRQRQLECALLILQNGGETLGPGWPTILQVIGDGANTQGSVLGCAKFIFYYHYDTKILYAINISRIGVRSYDTIDLLDPMTL